MKLKKRVKIFTRLCRNVPCFRMKFLLMGWDADECGLAGCRLPCSDVMEAQNLTI